MTVSAVAGTTGVPDDAAGHRRSSLRGVTDPLSRGVRRPGPAVGGLPHAHAAGGDGHSGDRGSETDGYVQGAHGQPPPG
ncbi:hypothetical protein ACH4UM_14140 [Streptomyces sp. NPDC020801]|uniref:hypothetical protein n=1 Tax=Streptomyces sp. NPDC020801 TaxID=3365093 RepID=UPI0037B71992